MNSKIIAEVRSMRKSNTFAYISSINDEGFPQVKCMFNLKSDDIKTHYFSTNTSSARVAQYRKNPKASVYYSKKIPSFKGALFTGTMEVVEDSETKERFWNKGDEKYYPKGVTDPDYCILKFTAETVNFYSSLKNTTIAIDDI
ncbi:MAG: pyridoxamine 5'-phosphate oxidase family protein [Oscillospiraceae bacterium]|nr:pyridoxamine 5'-phosphate oxidase family protein [Oscillospiraceae bacterium]